MYLCRLKEYWFLPTNKDLLILETNIGRPLKMENMRYNIVCPKKYTIPFYNIAIFYVVDTFEMYSIWSVFDSKLKLVTD